MGFFNREQYSTPNTDGWTKEEFLGFVSDSRADLVRWIGKNLPNKAKVYCNSIIKDLNKIEELMKTRLSKRVHRKASALVSYVNIKFAAAMISILEDRQN
jgi:hypothetical protein